MIFLVQSTVRTQVNKVGASAKRANITSLLRYLSIYLLFVSLMVDQSFFRTSR